MENNTIKPETTRYQALGEVASLTIQLAKLTEERDVKAKLAIQCGATPTELAHSLGTNRASVDRRYFARARYKEQQASKKGGKK